MSEGNKKLNSTRQRNGDHHVRIFVEGVEGPALYVGKVKSGDVVIFSTELLDAEVVFFANSSGQTSPFVENSFRVGSDTRKRVVATASSGKTEYYYFEFHCGGEVSPRYRLAVAEEGSGQVETRFIFTSVAHASIALKFSRTSTIRVFNLVNTPVDLHVGWASSSFTYPLKPDGHKAFFPDPGGAQRYEFSLGSKVKINPRRMHPMESGGTEYVEIIIDPD